MSWSWKIGRIAGIPVYVHWTFLILLAYFGFSYWNASHDVQRTLVGLGFILSLFGCVVLHELGHALAARRYGVGTTDITLLPIGGVARLERIPEQPGKELVIALAGPAVNLAIMIVLYLLGARLPQVRQADELARLPFLTNLMVANAFLAFFNLIPAFPMDGGRVLRALLAMRMDYAQATRVAASVGQLLAIGFGFLGLVGNPFLLLIALFVWIGAEQEARAVQERVALRGLSVREAMLTDYKTIAPTDTLDRAAQLLLAGSQHDFPVIGPNGAVAGVLTRSSLLSGLAAAGPEGRVADYLSAGLGAVDGRSPLGPAVARLREGGDACLLVTEAGRSIGLLTLENVGEYLMVRTALADARAGHAAAAPA